MLNFIELINLSFTYPTFTNSLFNSVNLRIHRGWTGIVGPNGSGKSTLLKLITGELHPDSGKILLDGTSYYCEQRTDEIPEGINEFISSYDKHAFKIKNTLEIDDEWITRWDKLSHGERKRLQVGMALFFNPDVLALDEPSNHLDNKTRQMLFNAMRSFENIGLLVSHDRYFLDNLCTHTLFIEQGKIELRKTNYSTAVEEISREDQFNTDRINKIKKEVEYLKISAHTQKQKADQADKLRSKRKINPKDKDAKGKIDLARLTNKDALVGKHYRKILNSIERKQDTLNSIQIRKKEKLGINISTGGTHALPFYLSGVQLNAGPKKIIIPDLMIDVNDKIGITGDNGTGKSTFIQYLVSVVNSDKMEMVYIPQEIPDEQNFDLIQKIHDYKDEEKSRIMTLIKRLNSDPVRLMETEKLSPGETRKLMLAAGIIKRPSIIIMDEPTNHMDLSSIESIETALAEINSALILVSHDTIFLKRLVTRMWHFSNIDEHTTTLKEIIT